MGAWGAIVMGLFGTLFAALTMNRELHWSGLRLGWPFVTFAVIAVAAVVVIRQPGAGPTPSKRAQRAMMWSTVAEGVGIFIASNMVVQVGHPELLLPAMALVVGLHFLPIARAAAFWPFYVLGAALLFASAVGFGVRPPAGSVVAGAAAAAALWTAAVLALRREHRSKRTTALRA